MTIRAAYPDFAGAVGLNGWTGRCDRMDMHPYAMVMNSIAMRNPLAARPVAPGSVGRVTATQTVAPT